MEEIILTQIVYAAFKQYLEEGSTLLQISKYMRTHLLPKARKDFSAPDCVKPGFRNSKI